MTTGPSDPRRALDGTRRRARELGLELGPYPAGQDNAITDVAGIRVGQVSVIEGDSIRTGVTAIVPDAVDRAGGQLPAGLFVDYAIAFATATAPGVADAALRPVFAAVQDAVEEAILNSVFMATTTTGYLGRVRHAVPLDLVTRACRAAGVLGDYETPPSQRELCKSS